VRVRQHDRHTALLPECASLFYPAAQVESHMRGGECLIRT